MGPKLMVGNADVGVGVGTGVRVGTDAAPGDTEVVGVDGGRTGAVGQLASAGLKGVGEGVGEKSAAVGLAVGVALVVAAAVADEAGNAGGVTTYGV